MARVVRAREAVGAIEDGATVAVGCMGLSGWPEEVARALEASYLETGHPRDLSVV